MLLRLLVLLASVVAPADDVWLFEEPRRVHSVDPQYPPEAAREELEADVTVECTVDRSGRVEQARVQSGPQPFREAALAAVRQWRYEPDPRPRTFTVDVRFRLPHKAIHREPFAAVFEAARARAEGPRRDEAWRELRDRGARVLPDLLRELRSDRPDSQCMASVFVGALGAAGRRAGPALLAAAEGAVRRGSDACVSGATLLRVAPETWVAALDRAATTNDAALCHLLVSGFDWHPDSVPRTAVKGLEVQGCRAATASMLHAVEGPSTAPDVLRVLATPLTEGRTELLHALARSVAGRRRTEGERWRPQAIETLVAALADPDGEVRQTAASVLGWLGPDAAPATTALARALDDPSLKVRGDAVRALAAIGLGARAAGPRLLLLREVRSGDAALANAVPEPDLVRAIQATRAGRDEAQIAMEDEIRAALVAHLVSQRRESDTPPRFDIVVLEEPRPAGLLQAVARRGVEVEPGGSRLELFGVRWIALDLVHVGATISGAFDHSSAVYILGLKDGRWTVVGSHSHWITAGPRPPRTLRAVEAPGVFRPASPWEPVAPPSAEG